MSLKGDPAKSADVNGEISAHQQARILAEALPHLIRYDEQTVVIKFGGHAMGDEALEKVLHVLPVLRAAERGVLPTDAEAAMQDHVGEEVRLPWREPKGLHRLRPVLERHHSPPRPRHRNQSNVWGSTGVPPRPALPDRPNGETRAGRYSANPAAAFPASCDRE